MLVLTVLLTV